MLAHVANWQRAFHRWGFSAVVTASHAIETKHNMVTSMRHTRKGGGSTVFKLICTLDRPSYGIRASRYVSLSACIFCKTEFDIRDRSICFHFVASSLWKSEVFLSSLCIGYNKLIFCMAKCTLNRPTESPRIHPSLVLPLAFCIFCKTAIDNRDRSICFDRVA